MAEGSSAIADPPNPTNPPDPPKPGETQNPRRPPKPKPAEEEQKPSAASKKRKLDHVEELRNSTYFKIRSIINDLRPLFIEVIHAPDFQESKAAHDIRKQMKTIIELTRQLRNEAPASTKPKKLNEEQPIKEDKHEEREKQEPQPQNGGIQGNSLVTGGSPVGWNFLFHEGGSDPVYYGETKASFRSRQIAQ